MKVHLVITDDQGVSYEGVASMAPIQRAAKRSERRADGKHAPATPLVSELSFSSNSRAFMNRHGRGMSGPQKFTLLLAFLAKGKPAHAIPVEQITAAWKRMKSVMGGAFNPAYTTRAKDKGWIDSPKKGVYVLADSWKDILRSA